MNAGHLEQIWSRTAPNTVVRVHGVATGLCLTNVYSAWTVTVLNSAVLRWIGHWAQDGLATHDDELIRRGLARCVDEVLELVARSTQGPLQGLA